MAGRRRQAQQAVLWAVGAHMRDRVRERRSVCVRSFNGEALAKRRECECVKVWQRAERIQKERKCVESQVEQRATKRKPGCGDTSKPVWYVCMRVHERC